ncbi:MAG: Ribonuclease toxin, BrnT, of type toxin-antitoxin system [Herbaspirillum sp.]|nr:Ribonuclease toxin, BrnT, of type toxin-antitoxin system [Herbaspirillum sp.]
MTSNQTLKRVVLADCGAVLDNAHVGDIHGAFGSISASDVAKFIFAAIGYAPMKSDRLYCVVFIRRANGLRIISLRKANQREFDYYVSKIDTAY